MKHTPTPAQQAALTLINGGSVAIVGRDRQHASTLAGDVLAACPDWIKDGMKWPAVLANGARLVACAVDETERFRGLQFDKIWWALADCREHLDAWRTVMLCLRKPDACAEAKSK